MERQNGIIVYNPKDLPTKGIVFLLATWSESVYYLKYLVSLLEEYPQLELYVYDIDEIEYIKFETEYNVLSHGVGETFAMIENKIIFKFTDYKNNAAVLNNLINNISVSIYK